MESELEALAAQPESPGEPPFQALVEAAGGRGQVLLVGELWEREQSRALLWDFARAVFPPQQAAGKPGGGAAEGAGPGAPGVPKRHATGARAIRSPLVFVLCRASSLAARGPRRHLREMLRDVRGRRRAGAALVGVLVAEAEPEDAGAPELRLLEALLRTVFGRQAGGPVQAAAYRPGHPASSLAVQAAACRGPASRRALAPRRSLGETRPSSTAGVLFLGSLEPGKDPDTSSRSGPAQGDLQDSEEELVLMAVYPNGDCEDPGKGSKPCDRVASAPTEPAGDLR